ncbi:hypothetical protein BU26DRAFT_184390, partial [Trematosphaeria pertusa]
MRRGKLLWRHGLFRFAMRPLRRTLVISPGSAFFRGRECRADFGFACACIRLASARACAAWAWRKDSVSVTNCAWPRTVVVRMGVMTLKGIFDSTNARTKSSFLSSMRCSSSAVCCWSRRATSASTSFTPRAPASRYAATMSSSRSSRAINGTDLRLYRLSHWSTYVSASGQVCAKLVTGCVPADVFRFSLGSSAAGDDRGEKDGLGGKRSRELVPSMIGEVLRAV